MLLVVGCPKKNHAPDAPSVPSGPSAVAKSALATFSSAATDPDGDSVCIRFDWGDGDTSDWSQYVESDGQALMSHAWSAVGVCSVRAQAKDRSSLTSTWSLVHTVQVTAAGDTWSRTFGGADEDIAYSVRQTSDGGYVVAGYTDSYGAGRDAWLIKTDAAGNRVWDKTFGGGVGSSVRQTSDGGYIIAGYTESSNLWLIKTNVSGNEVWSRTLGGDRFVDEGYWVQQTSDGGYIVAGRTASFGAGYFDVWLVKADALGDTVWTRTHGGEGRDEGYSVQQTSDGGYIVAGSTESYGAGWSDVWLIKTDADGNKAWDRTFGGESDEYGYSVQQTSDGGYIIVGETWSYGAGACDVWLIKTDTSGNKVWDKTFGGEAQDDWGHSVQQTSDGGYIIAGYTCSYGAGWCGDVWLIKVDADGHKAWDRTFGDEWGYERAYSVQQTSDGGYIIAGYTESFGADSADVWLIKTSGP
jgi:hypothetical protein